jgi:beta-lactamase superfamily II metal-dependent hydrolase
MEAFANYPAPFVLDKPNGKRKQQVIWGDHITVKAETPEDGWIPVHARNADGYLRAGDIQPKRLLELNFIDVGQGDSCFIVTPDDEYFLIDAGENDNLWWFLRWRFNLRNDPDRVLHIKHLVITHFDRDHYGGLEALLTSPQVRIGNLWHNGLIERANAPRLGPSTDGYLTDLIATRSALEGLLGDEAEVRHSTYLKLIKAALADGHIENTAMASTDLGYLPGYGSGERPSLQVLSPAVRRLGDKLCLPEFSSVAQTKNGHSVVLRLRYGSVSVLLGGDLNAAAEKHLIAHHTNGAQDPTAAARAAFGVDIAKVCHHGSADFRDDFLEYEHPAAWVVSSGDDEPYAHPRPDTLGALGRHGRGERPLIFSTELARSPRETAHRPESIRAAHAGEIERGAAEIQSSGRSGLEESGALADYQRSIAVYGMVTVRTDGTKALISTKLERPGPGGQQWDYYRLEPNPDGVLQRVLN